MILKIDSAVSVRINPASGDRAPSVVLDLLGGSLWFPRDACPSSLSEGCKKCADVELSARNVRIGERTRTVFVPVRLVSVG